MTIFRVLKPALPTLYHIILDKPSRGEYYFPHSAEETEMDTKSLATGLIVIRLQSEESNLEVF